MKHSINPARRRFAIPAILLVALMIVTAAGPAASEPAGAATAADRSPLEATYLAAPVQVTTGLIKAGEGYFSPSAGQICYQGVPEGYPFYQIYIQPFSAAAPRVAAPTRISSGRGRTTCSFFSPDGSRLLFASSHTDPNLEQTEADARAQAAEDARTGRRRRYQWDFDPHMDIFSTRPDGSGLEQLTNTPGYDAECSYSPDGKQILFVSDRDGDPDIYVMAADGSSVRQLTDQPGYDGGPFFSPDANITKWILQLAKDEPRNRANTTDCFRPTVEPREYARLAAAQTRPNMTAARLKHLADLNVILEDTFNSSEEASTAVQHARWEAARTQAPAAPERPSREQLSFLKKLGEVAVPAPDVTVDTLRVALQSSITNWEGAEP